MPPLSEPLSMDGTICAYPSSEPTQLIPKQSRRHRRVRFRKMCLVVLHIHINDITPQEFQDCWYTEEETLRMRKEMKKDIHALRCSTTQAAPSVSVCRRGLECRMPETAKLLLFNKQRSIKAVITKQQDQRRFGCCDPNAISTAYSRTTASSAMAAQRRGLQDERDGRD